MICFLEVVWDTLVVYVCIGFISFYICFENNSNAVFFALQTMYILKHHPHHHIKLEE